MQGEPALPPDFKHLPYANPDALQGGTLRQAVTGSFDSLNPFIVKGNPAQGIRTYVFESLLGRNWAEPFSLYGLLAESIDVSDDRKVFTFVLRPEARFSDGTPVTPDDVIFSLETLRDHGRPNFKNSYSKVTKIEKMGDRKLTFSQETGDRELPLIIGVMPILSKKSWEGKSFEETTMTPLIGSGPYVISDAKADENITYKKNADYWGKSLALNKGLWNFDAVRFDYYRDSNSAFEAFKKGDADFRIETEPSRWTSGYEFPAVKSGKVIVEKIEQRTPEPTIGFAFNTRRPIFADPVVREALIAAFDFEWANANLFGNAYRRIYGYFSGSSLSSQGRAADNVELSILGSASTPLTDDHLKGNYKLPVSDGSGRDRKLLRKVVAQLAESGWSIKEGKLRDSKGTVFEFTITVQSDDQQRIALHYKRTLEQIGIQVNVKMVDATQFSAAQKNYDYDMIPVTWFNSLSPGNEQKLYFGSSGRDTPGTRNYPGIADPRIDAAIEKMLHATSREEFESAVRAEDRLLVAGHYIIPLYGSGGQWVARWSSIARPQDQPLPGIEATTMWKAKP